mmetsp:Transcript_130807/g.279832  ORF Transcript_130807/g.279832 Transcript_130807/m.279832 type:complete len:210 (-) Transcript_130807:351-980(-)
MWALMLSPMASASWRSGRRRVRAGAGGGKVPLPVSLSASTPCQRSLAFLSSPAPLRARRSTPCTALVPRTLREPRRRRPPTAEVVIATASSGSLSSVFPWRARQQMLDCSYFIACAWRRLRQPRQQPAPRRCHRHHHCRWGPSWNLFRCRLGQHHLCRPLHCRPVRGGSGAAATGCRGEKRSRGYIKPSTPAAALKAVLSVMAAGTSAW